MNTLTTRTMAAAAGLLATTIGAALANSAPAQAADDWKRERGIVLECEGTKAGLTLRTTVYENNRHGNVIQVGIGDPDLDNDAGRHTDVKFLVDGAVRATVKVGGKRAVITGTAERIGPRTPISENIDDGGMNVRSRGFQRQLHNDLVATYDGTVVPLTCDTAFYYDLQVKRTPIT